MGIPLSLLLVAKRRGLPRPEGLAMTESFLLLDFGEGIGVGGLLHLGGVKVSVDLGGA